MSKPDDLYNELRQIITEIEAKFIQPYLPPDPESKPATFALDVKSYCILAHAAFEDYFEQVSLAVMEHLLLAVYDGRRKIDRGLLIFLGTYGGQITIEDETKKTFDHLRESFEHAKSAFSDYVFNNHGISPKKYLAQLMLPVGVDVPQDPNWLNSLDQLAKERGQYAHKGAVTRILSPEDAKNYVADCLLLSDSIKKQAEKKISR
jgi:hypothetical protein